MSYHEFLEGKSHLDTFDGFAPTYTPDFLFDFQRALLDWAVRKGRAAIFADCGMGKTPMQLAWAQNIVEHTNKPVLIVTPLVGVTLCGSAFGLGVRRHRIFEGNIAFDVPPACRHTEQGRPIGVYHKMADEIPSGGRTATSLAEGRNAMGIDWMDWEELIEAIPPAYTEWIGARLLSQRASSG